MYCTTGTRQSGECLYPAGNGTGSSGGEKSGPSGGESTGLVQRQSKHRRLLTRVLCSTLGDLTTLQTKEGVHIATLLHNQSVSWSANNTIVFTTRLQ
jgi:hypothetical protein